MAVVTCGGTISMSTGSDGIRRPAGSSDVAAAVEALADCPVSVVPAGEMESADITPAGWERVLRAVRSAGDGTPTVVTHGTDTLAWTAGMLAAAGGWTAPVVVTGANTPFGEAGSDAAANLAAAAAVARQAGPGVHVVFTGGEGTPAEVFQGGFVRKVRASGQPFDGLPRRLGTVAGGTLSEDGEWRPVAVRCGEAFRRRVAVVRCHPALDAGMLRSALDGPAAPDAVVVELYACATAPAAAVELVRTCSERGVPVLACPPSPVTEAVYPSTSAIADAGASVHLGGTVELLVPVAASLP